MKIRIRALFFMIIAASLFSFALSAYAAAKTDISTGTLKVTFPTTVYNGKVQKAEPLSVTHNGKTLVKGTDYSLTYPGDNCNYIDARYTHNVVIHGKGSYTGSVTRSYRIDPCPITADHVTLTGLRQEKFTDKVVYTPDELVYSPDTSKVFQMRVRVNGVTLSEGKDYEITGPSFAQYGKYGNVDCYYVRGAFGSNYSADLSIAFHFKKRNIKDVSYSAVFEEDFTGREVKPTAMVYNFYLDGKRVSVINNHDLDNLEIKYENNIQPGTAKFKVVVKQSRYFYGETNWYTFIIKQPVPITSLKTSVTEMKMLTHSSARLTETSKNDAAMLVEVAPAEAAGLSLVWKSSNNSVATVEFESYNSTYHTQLGRIVGKKPGWATITASTADGKYKASCKVQVLERKEYPLKAGKEYTFQSRLSKQYSLDVMYMNYAKNTNVSLYKTTKGRGAQKLTAEKVVKNGVTYWAFVRKNSQAGKRALTLSIKDLNINFAPYNKDWSQLYRVYRFSDGSIQLVQTSQLYGEPNKRVPGFAISVSKDAVGQRVNIEGQVPKIEARQRWYGVVN